MPKTAPLPVGEPRHAEEDISTELGWRIANLLNIYRFLVAGVLLSVFVALSDPRAVGGHAEELFQVVSVAYLLLGLAGLIAARQRRPALGLQLRWCLMADIFIVGLLLHASGGVSSNIGILLILPIGASSFALPTRTALMYASIAALAILFEQSASWFEGITLASDFFPAGVVGLVTFVSAAVVLPFAQRLRRSEALAAQRGIDLANLSELNDYIIQHLRESILVLDADDTIRLINGTASRHLGMSERQIGQHIGEVFPDLADLAREWRVETGESRSTLRSLMSADGTTMLTPHFAPIGDSIPAPTLVFLEDATALAERVQQSKLASLGRLSASIAHEIRNPVGAISHAGQLLGESENLGAEERRLADIIHSHCGRVSEIVSNVLQLSRRDQAEPQLLALANWLHDFLIEFAANTGLDVDRFGVAVEHENTDVRMDPSHLRQILWNLCENALRYGAPPDGDDELFRIRAGRLASTSRPFLEVLDRGPGIARENRQLVFEPFFTGAEDGTGLGLFIARELSEVNGATLVYETREGGGACFRIIFADPERWVI